MILLLRIDTKFVLLVNFSECAYIVDNEDSFVHAVAHGNVICSIVLSYTLLECKN